MRKIYFALTVCLLQFAANAQIFDVDTLQYKGDSDKFINLVVMGDGFTAAQQDDFIGKATNLTDYLLGQEPWSNYKNYFNVFAIKVISAQSGTKHANTASDCNTAFPAVPVSSPTTYFGCRFDYIGIHRLVVPQFNSAIASVLAANMPNYDQVMILANTPYYGGSGGSWATCTADEGAYDVTAHEMAHSFANLADEYYAGDNYFSERPNMTQQSNPNLIKWKNWLTDDITDIGIENYCCGGNTALWYKPTHMSCKMEIYGVPYCRVCKETIIEKIHVLANPIVEYTPTSLNIESSEALLDFNLSELMKPEPNTLHIKWQLDTSIFDSNSETFQVDPNMLPLGIHTLTASVVDETELVRVDNHAALHVHSVTWTINKTGLGVAVASAENKFGYAIYPNPSEAIVTIALDLDKNSSVAIDLIALDGKKVREIPAKMASEGKFEQQINIESLASGTYQAVVKIDGVQYSKALVKE
ncbi:MAG TPA: M64 family metallopeptidase [Flavobacterium sp.]|nr:M64 family metallopeptidase [Flavobacterium sp.]